MRLARHHEPSTAPAGWVLWDLFLNSRERASPITKGDGRQRRTRSRLARHEFWGLFALLFSATCRAERALRTPGHEGGRLSTSPLFRLCITHRPWTCCCRTSMTRPGTPSSRYLDQGPGKGRRGDVDKAQPARTTRLLWSRFRAVLLPCVHGLGVHMVAAPAAAGAGASIVPRRSQHLSPKSSQDVKIAIARSQDTINFKDWMDWNTLS